MSLTVKLQKLSRVCLAAVMSLALTLNVTVLNASENKINIQGKFTQNDLNKTPLATDDNYVIFRLYDTPTVGTGKKYFAERHNDVDLSATAGVYNLLLGNGTTVEGSVSFDSVKFDKPLYLEIQLNNDTPTERQTVSASGYAPGSAKDFNVANNLGAANIYGTYLNVNSGSNATNGIFGGYGTQNKLYVQNGDYTTHTGDPSVVWAIPGARAWMAGIDNSDSYKWKLASGEAIDWSGTALAITTDGNVGVGGITNPTQKLHVGGITQITDGIQGESASWGTLMVTRTNSANPLSYIALTRSMNIIYGMGIDAGNNWLFGYPNSSGQITNPRLAITPAGKIGIGTTSPTVDLDIVNVTSGIGLQVASADTWQARCIDTNSITTGSGGGIGLGGKASNGTTFTAAGIKAVLEYGPDGNGAAGYGLAFYTAPEYNPPQQWMRLSRWGKLCIGTTDASYYKMYLVGDAHATGVWEASDINMKDNIEIINENPVAKLVKLKPIKYTLKKDVIKKKKFSKEILGKVELKDEINKELEFCDEKQIGLSAQELEADFPELVKTDADGYKAVSYSRLSVILLEAMKEQQKKIEALEAAIVNLNNKKVDKQ